MVSSPDFATCAVEVGNVTSYMQRGSKLAALFGLIFRRASCQHPLLAGALGEHQALPFDNVVHAFCAGLQISIILDSMVLTGKTVHSIRADCFIWPISHSDYILMACKIQH